MKNLLHLLLLFTLFSCSSSNQVVSNRFVQKRKYSKGFHLNRLSKLKLEHNGILLDDINSESVTKSIKKNDNDLDSTYRIFTVDKLRHNKDLRAKNQQSLFDSNIDENVVQNREINTKTHKIRFQKVCQNSLGAISNTNLPSSITENDDKVLSKGVFISILVLGSILLVIDLLLIFGVRSYYNFIPGIIAVLLGVIMLFLIIRRIKRKKNPVVQEEIKLKGSPMSDTDMKIIWTVIFLVLMIPVGYALLFLGTEGPFMLAAAIAVIILLLVLLSIRLVKLVRLRRITPDPENTIIRNGEKVKETTRSDVSRKILWTVIFLVLLIPFAILLRYFLVTVPLLIIGLALFISLLVLLIIRLVKLKRMLRISQEPEKTIIGNGAAN